MASDSKHLNFVNIPSSSYWISCTSVKTVSLNLRQSQKSRRSLTLNTYQRLPDMRSLRPSAEPTHTQFRYIDGASEVYFLLWFAPEWAVNRINKNMNFQTNCINSMAFFLKKKLLGWFVRMLCQIRNVLAVWFERFAGEKAHAKVYNCSNCVKIWSRWPPASDS